MGIATFLNEGHPPTRLRGLRFLSFNEAVTIQRGTVVSDGGGGGTTTWANVGTAQSRVTCLGGSPRLMAGRIDENSTHLVTSPDGTNVKTSDRVVIPTRGTWQVTSLYDSTDARTVRFEIALI